MFIDSYVSEWGGFGLTSYSARDEGNGAITLFYFNESFLYSSIDFNFRFLDLVPMFFIIFVDAVPRSLWYF